MQAPALYSIVNAFSLVRAARTRGETPRPCPRSIAVGPGSITYGWILTQSGLTSLRLLVSKNNPFLCDLAVPTEKYYS